MIIKHTLVIKKKKGLTKIQIGFLVSPIRIIYAVTHLLFHFHSFGKAAGGRLYQLFIMVLTLLQSRPSPYLKCPSMITFQHFIGK